MVIFFIILLLLVLIIAYKTIKVVKQSEVYVIERLGKFHKVADAGLTIIFPFLDHVRSVVSLKQQTMDIPPQGVITKDNVTITIDTVVFYKITDPAKAVYEIQSLKKGIEYLAITTIRDIVGKMDLDATFSSRDAINDKLRAILDEATDQWGCKIDRVEIKDITPPADIRDAMEKQMNAERNKRAWQCAARWPLPHGPSRRCQPVCRLGYRFEWQAPCRCGHLPNPAAADIRAASGGGCDPRTERRDGLLW